MIVLTAPTGDIGSQVLTHLLARNEPLRLIARDPSKLSRDIRDRVEVVTGSHSDPAVVDKAFAGAEAVFWLVPGDPQAKDAEAAYVGFTRPVLAAFQRHKIKRIVNISALGRGWAKPAGHVTATLRMEDLLIETGVAYRGLSCPSLMENLLRQAESIRSKGMFFWPSPGDLPVPTIATRDVAAFAADLLDNRQWGGAQDIPLLGPDDLSFNAMAAIMSEVLGWTIRFQDIAMEDFKTMMLSRGYSEGMAQAMVDMLTAKNDSMDHMIARDDAVICPTDFRTWCRDVLKPAVLG